MVQFKNRYFVMEVIVDPNRETGDSQPIVLSCHNVTKSIEHSIQLNFGDYGLASSLTSFQGHSLTDSICWPKKGVVQYHSDQVYGFIPVHLAKFVVKYVNPITKICIIRASRDDHQKIWAAITLVRTIGKCPVLFNLLDLSGCIRVCRRKALECEETKIEQYILTLGGPVTSEFENSVKSNFGKIKALES